MLVKVNDTKFVRDTTSMALINTDEVARNEYYSKAKMIRTQKEEINNIKKDILDVREDVLEIKALLRQLLANK